MFHAVADGGVTLAAEALEVSGRRAGNDGVGLLRLAVLEYAGPLEHEGAALGADFSHHPFQTDERRRAVAAVHHQILHLCVAFDVAGVRFGDAGPGELGLTLSLAVGFLVPALDRNPRIGRLLHFSPRSSRSPPLAPRQGHPGEGPAHAGAVVVQVPLPGVRGAIVEERVVETVGGAVGEQKGNGVAGHGTVSDAAGIERAGAGVVEPETGVFPARRIPPEEHHRLVDGSAVGPALARHLAHLDVLAAQHPLEGHVVRSLLAPHGAAEHPVPDEPVEERIRGQRLRPETARRERESDTESRRLAHVPVSEKEVSVICAPSTSSARQLARGWAVAGPRYFRSRRSPTPIRMTPATRSVTPPRKRPTTTARSAVSASQPWITRRASPMAPPSRPQRCHAQEGGAWNGASGVSSARTTFIARS